MNIARAREIAAEIRSAGVTRIRFESSKLEDVKKAITRDDIKELIVNKGIVLIPEIGTSRGRARVAHKRKKAGRGRKPGSKKGTLNARNPPKKAWMRKVRALRKKLIVLRQDEGLESAFYRNTYLRIKGNWFRDKKHLVQYVKENKEKK